MKAGLRWVYWVFQGSLLLLLTACETSVELNPNFLPKLTIVSQIAPNGWDEGQRVYVFSSQTPSDSSQFSIPDELEVFVTEIETETTIKLKTYSDEGKVFFKIPEGFLKAGSGYRISAKAPGFESVSATTIIPMPSGISDLSVKTIIIEQSELNLSKKNLRYTLQFMIDHFESNQYYHLVFYNEYFGDPVAYIIEPELSDKQTFIHHYDYGVLVDRDDLMEGEPLAFNFVDWVVEGSGLKRISVELRTVTEEYYKYHSTLARQLIVRQDPFAEPVSIYNNIEGGYGNFSGFTRDVTSSDLPQ